MQSEEATFFLGPENEVQRVLATGNVNAESSGDDADQVHARADEAEMLLTSKQNLLHTATLTGNVHVERIGSQPMQGDAGRAILDFQAAMNCRKCTPPTESIWRNTRTAPPRRQRMPQNMPRSGPQNSRIST